MPHFNLFRRKKDKAKPAVTKPDVAAATAPPAKRAEPAVVPPPVAAAAPSATTAPLAVAATTTSQQPQSGDGTVSSTEDAMNGCESRAIASASIAAAKTSSSGGSCSGASTPAEARSLSGDEDDDGSHKSSGSCQHPSTSRRPSTITMAGSNHGTTPNHPTLRRSSSMNEPGNPKTLKHSTSAIGLDEMIEDRREGGTLGQNVVHIEVPFGKPIEEVYDGVHTGPVLGSGISGLVRLVTHKATGLKYAVKVLDLALVETPTGLQQLREEIFIMCQLDHPNIVRLEEVYESHSEIYLVQELCLGGELFDRLDEQPDYHYTEAECARLVKQMLSAVRYLHSKGIIHRDLKLENFLFSSVNADSELKMIDFGLSKHFMYGEVQSEAVGTPYTVAPEVIRGSYDERCDVWAIGVIAFLLLSGEPPFGGCGGPESLMQVRSNILMGRYEFEPADIWEQVSEQARHFILTLLVTDPQKRPTARHAQQHKWLQEWAQRAMESGGHGGKLLSPNVVKALVNFKEFSDMRKLLCEVLSFTLLPDQIKELRREFEKMDTDGSGEISLAALKQVLMTNAGAGSLGALTEDEVTDIFDAMRVRKTETRIHWHEFIAAGLSQCSVDDRNLRLAFDRLDSDHKGYITLDDIMDLMGSDALQSEDAMRRMWGDSIKAVKCQHARITYDDFLLLMKGQSKEVPGGPGRSPSPAGMDLGASISTLVHGHGSGGKLSMVPETGLSLDEDDIPPAIAAATSLEREPQTTASDNDSGGPLMMESDNNGITVTVDMSNVVNRKNATGETLVPAVLPQLAKRSGSLSAPSTPSDHKRILEMEEELDAERLALGETPLSMDDDDDIPSAGPGVPGSAASLTPPLTPERGIADYCTPLSGRRTIEFLKGDKSEGLLLPGFPPKPLSPYERRRSQSLDETKEREAQEQELKDLSLKQKSPTAIKEEVEGEDEDEDQKSTDLNIVADVVKDMLLPEADHVHNSNAAAKEIEAVVKDRTKSNLVVNRKLYRAHRQMRLAVLEASKRFEEQQTQYARDMILAQREKEGQQLAVGGVGAGLVMRHGHNKQVSSEQIRQMLAETRQQEQALVEKANRRGGRGRRSRKKTISDMSGMLSSMGQDEMGIISQQAAATSSAENVLTSVGCVDEANPPLTQLKHAQTADPALLRNAYPPPKNTALKTGTMARPPSVPEEEVPAVPEHPPQPPPGTEGHLRAATVPGEFRKTTDPFGSHGRYRHVASAWDKESDL